MQSLVQSVFSLGPLKRFIATTLQAQLSKYIVDVQLEELGLLGGDVVLENLELRHDVLQRVLGDKAPEFKLARGYIRELRIKIPWTQLAGGHRSLPCGCVGSGQ